MSLILDALRKSEAERRRGQAPSLYSHSPPLGTRREPPWKTLLPVAAGVLALLAATVFWLRRDEAPVTKEELVEQAEAPSPVPPLQTSGAPATPPPPPVAVPAPLPAAPATVARPNVDALVQPAPAKPVEAPHAPPAIVAPATAPTPAAPEEEALPPVAVLDPGTRAGLPPMKLSMHVYNVDPTRRFAILDGQRVTEGSQIGAAIVLEIRRDGVVLYVAGKRVLLPRP